MISKAWVVLGAVVAAVLVALLAVPSVIDWNGYKPEVIGRIEGALGRQVTIGGPLSLSLLPVPAFSAKDVRIANLDGAASPDMARLPELHIRLRPLALLSGRIEVSSLSLVAPEIHLEKLPDGRGNWQFTGDTSTASGSLTKAPPISVSDASPVGSGRGLRIDALEVKGGSLVYQGSRFLAGRLDDIDATVTRSDSDGTLHVVGSARHGGTGFSFDAMAGALADGQPAPVSLTVGLAKGAGELKIAGQVAGVGDQRRFKGKATLKAADLPRFADAWMAGAGARLPSGPLAVDARLAASADEATAEGMTLALAGLQAEGSAGLGFGSSPRLNLALAARRVDLDALLARALTANTPAAASTGPAAPPSDPERREASHAAEFSIPKDVAANIDLSADALTYHGAILRGARLNAALANAEVAVNQLGVSLPGNATVNVFGFIVAADGRPSFDGSVDASTDDLRGLLDWMKLDASKVPPDRLHAARLAAQLKANSDEIRFEGGSISLDASRIEAAATLRTGPRPAIGASFAVDSFNADAYWPQQPAAAHPVTADASAASTPAPATAAPGPVAGTSWLDGIDANLKGRVGQLVFRGQTSHDLAVDATWHQGVLTVHDATAADDAGSQLRLKGDVEGLSGGVVRLRGVHYDFHGKQPGHVLRQLAPTLALPVDLDRFAPMSLSGTIDGAADQVTVDALVEAAGAGLKVHGTVSTPLSTPKLDLGIEASHASFPQFARLFAPDYRPKGQLGAFAASARLVGGTEALDIGDLTLKVGSMSAAGQAHLTLTGTPRLDASLTAGDVAIDPFLPAARKGEARRSPPKDPEPAAPVARKAEVRRSSPTDEEPAPPMAAPRPSVQVSAVSEHWSRDPVDLSWLRTMDASVKIDATAITWGATRIGGANLVLTLSNGVASLEHLTGQLYGGHLVASGKIDADGGATLQAGLTQAQMHEALLSIAGLGLAEGAMDAEASLTTAGHSTAEMIGRLQGGGKFAVSNGDLRGFDLQAANERLAKINSPASLFGLLQAGAAGGKTHFSSLTGSFHVDNGIVGSDDMQMTADGGTAKATAQVNLPAYVMDGAAEFRLAGEASGPPLVLRVTGPVDGPRQFLDVNPIETWLAQRAGRSNKGAGKLLGNLLGGADKHAQGSEPAAQDTSQPEKVKPKDLLKGLLQGLGR